MIHNVKRDDNDLLDRNQGPFNDNVIKQLFKEIFKASTDLQKQKMKTFICIKIKARRYSCNI